MIISATTNLSFTSATGMSSRFDNRLPSAKPSTGAWIGADTFNAFYCFFSAGGSGACELKKLLAVYQNPPPE